MKKVCCEVIIKALTRCYWRAFKFLFLLSIRPTTVTTVKVQQSLRFSATKLKCYMYIIRRGNSKGRSFFFFFKSWLSTLVMIVFIGTKGRTLNIALFLRWKCHILIGILFGIGCCVWTGWTYLNDTVFNMINSPKPTKRNQITNIKCLCFISCRGIQFYFT